MTLNTRGPFFGPAAVARSSGGQPRRLRARHDPLALGYHALATLPRGPPALDGLTEDEFGLDNEVGDDGHLHVPRVGQLLKALVGLRFGHGRPVHLLIAV